MTGKRPGFRQRKAYWAGRNRVDNSKPHPGSQVFYYCKLCGAETTMPECHIAPPPLFCDDCVTDGRARTHYQLAKRRPGAR